MPAFLIADIQVTDPTLYAEYAKGVPATIAAFQGSYRVRGGALEVVEGDWTPRRAVVLEFPSMALLRAWYDSPEYAPFKALRQRAADSRLVMVEGV